MSSTEAFYASIRAELDAIRPTHILCLGATAASALLGGNFPLMRERGRWHSLPDGTQVLATVHPSWVLRQASQDEAYALLLDDLRRVAQAVPGIDARVAMQWPLDGADRSMTDVQVPRPDVAVGRAVAPPLVHGAPRGQDRGMPSTPVLAMNAARTGRVDACVRNNNRNNASLPRAGD